jgi:hypothetical protein
MKKVILLSELNFNSCLAHVFINRLTGEDYTIQVSFVPEHELRNVISQAVDQYDLIIGISYQRRLFSKKLLAANPDKLLLLAHHPDEQGGKFISVLFEQFFDTETILLIEKIIEIFNDQIFQGIYLDLNAALATTGTDEDLEYLLFLRRRYLQALRVIETFYGQAEKIALHNNFLLEIVDNEGDYYWIDDLIQIHNLPEEDVPILPFSLDLMTN